MNQGKVQVSTIILSKSKSVLSMTSMDFVDQLKPVCSREQATLLEALAVRLLVSRSVTLELKMIAV